MMTRKARPKGEHALLPLDLIPMAFNYMSGIEICRLPRA
jgi:hypothetical protein